MQQKDALTVLLTGRGEHNFADLVKRIAASKKLQFDMVCLKPRVGPNNQRFSSTMNFKQALLEDIVYTYKEADEIRVYEDRPKQYTSHARRISSSRISLTNDPAPKASVNFLSNSTNPSSRPPPQPRASPSWQK